MKPGGPLPHSHELSVLGQIKPLQALPTHQYGIWLHLGLHFT